MIRVRQALLLAVALSVAAVMIVLGLWQMQVFRDQGDATAAQRAAQPARPLEDVATPGELPADGYGRTVTLSGRYLADQQFLVPVPGRQGHYRVLTALQRSDGVVVPVVRGEADSAAPPPPPPGTVREQGLFLASEAAVDEQPPPGQLGSVRLSEVAQSWSQPLLPGFVTLDAQHATAQGLTQAQVTLPSGEGHVRNGGYALQWWIFAGFGLVMAVKVIRDMGRRRDLPADADRAADRTGDDADRASQPANQEDQ